MSLNSRVASLLGIPRRRETRWYGWRPDVPDGRDLQAGPASGAPPQAVLPGAEQLLPPIRDQGDTGACTGFSVRSAIQYKRLALGQEPLELSPRFSYYNARAIEGTTETDAGAEIRNAIKGVHRLGISTEALCPYAEDVDERPTYAAYRQALTDIVAEYRRLPHDIETMKTVIASGDPFVFGFSVYENFESDQVARTGILDMPKGDLLGGHAAWIVGYDDLQVLPTTTGAFLAGNSWGTDWGTTGPNGERGYFWIPYRFLADDNLADDFWSISMVL